MLNAPVAAGLYRYGRKRKLNAGFDEGLFYVQDPAAKCAVLAAALEPGMNVLDSCAAPGGKSFAAAIVMQNEGSIDSCDLHDKKNKTYK